MIVVWREYTFETTQFDSESLKFAKTVFENCALATDSSKEEFYINVSFANIEKFMFLRNNKPNLCLLLKTYCNLYI